jgi:hypothetical protein
MIIVKNFRKLNNFNQNILMIIGVAGPYSAPTKQQRQKNLDAMNEAAARVLEMGHIPIIGMNAALPIVAIANIEDKYKATMDISLAVINVCEAILMISESPGANKERDLVKSKGLPVYYSLEEIPG